MAGLQRKQNPLLDPANVKRMINNVEFNIKKCATLLSNEGIDSNVRVDTERRMKSLKSELVERRQQLLEANLYVKYKYIKFVEKRKLMRMLRQQEKLAEKGEGGDKLMDDLERTRLYLGYIKYYPRDMKYIALFPSKKESSPNSVQSAILDYLGSKMSSLLPNSVIRKKDVFHSSALEETSRDEISTSSNDSQHDDDGDFFL